MRIPETRFTQTHNGASVAYQVYGEGPSNITWFPFIWGHLDIQWEEPGFRAALERFGSMGRVAQFDKRGSGLSDPLERAATLDDRMDDARAVLDAAGMERVFLGGLSEGGPLAILFAATYPERVDGLILINTFAGPVPGIPEEMHRAFVEAQEEVWETFIANWGDPASPIVEAFSPSRADDQAFRRWVARYTTNAMRPAGVRQARALSTAMNVVALLPAIQVPTLVIHVTGDRVIPRIAGEAVAAAIPGARFEAFEGEDHMYVCSDLRDPIIDCIEDFIRGSHAVKSTGRAVSTVLFTDIVDSTATATRLGDAAWRQVLDIHDELAADSVGLHGGRLVKSTGDGVLAMFPSPSRAIECAQDLRERVRRLGVEIRGGLHTGEVELRGEDVAGLAVHIASRVEASAGPGEVMVSRTVRDLVVGGTFRFEDRGTHELKGVEGAWELSSIV